MENGFAWQLRLPAAPARVFCSLVRAASEHGRVCGVEDYGTVLTYAPSRQDVNLVARMRASVRPCGSGGSLVRIEAAEPSASHPDAMAVQAGSVATLIRQLRRHYQEATLPDPSQSTGLTPSAA